jgi:hypothetical protein
MDPPENEYRIGFTFADQMVYLGRMLITTFLMIMIPVTMLFIILAFLSWQVEVLFLFVGTFIVLASLYVLFMLPVMFFIFTMQYFLIKRGGLNYVRFKRTRLRIARQLSSRAQRFSIEIPYTIINRVKKVDRFVLKKWRKRSRKFHLLSMGYTPGIGHLNHIMSRPPNLIVIYLRKKIKVRNYDFSNALIKRPPMRTRKVREIVVDIERERQEEFLLRMDGEIVKARVRMMDMKGEEPKKGPRVARPPPDIPGT